MIKFGFKEYTTEVSNWAKHHQSLGVWVARKYPNGETSETVDKILAKLSTDYPHKLKKKKVELFNRETNQIVDAYDYYLPLTNLEYKTATLDYYSIGSANTSQITHVRLTFLHEDARIVLDTDFSGAGSYAMSFNSFISNPDLVEDLTQEILDKNLPIEETGIVQGDDDDFKVIVVDSSGDSIDIELSTSDLYNSLVGIEVYKFDQKILEEF